MSHFVGRLWDRFRRVFIGLVDSEESNLDQSKGGARTLDFVQSAIYNLKDKNGSCFEDILDYLCRQYEVDESTIRGRVMAAIRRGVAIGVLEQNGNVYKLTICRDRKKHRRRKSTTEIQPKDECVKCKRNYFDKDENGSKEVHVVNDSDDDDDGNAEDY